WRVAVKEELDGFQILSRFGETDMTFVLTGWIPKKALRRLAGETERIVGGAVFIEQLPLNPALEQRAPVVMENPLPVRPFESLVRLLDLPRYNHIDPSALMAFFMPTFFGMMLGDVGYGLILLTLCLFLKRRY